jgi:hypothetical protein
MRTNFKHSEETKRKIGLSHLGIKPSEETKEKLRLSHLGKPLSEETKRKIRESRLKRKERLGYYHSKETKRKISLANTGRILSGEHKEKLRLCNLGRTPWNKGYSGYSISNEHKRKISFALKGKAWNKGTKNIMKKNSGSFKYGQAPWNKGLTKYNNESVKRIADSKLGKKRTDEQIARMSLIGKELVKKGFLPPSRKGIKFTEEQKDKLRGPLSHNWLGGKSFEPYDYGFNKRFKQLIKIRDGFMCQKCNMLDEDSMRIFKRSLDVHHVDYNKQLSIPENCVTLCIRCHTESNTNREAWKSFYQILLSNKYGYKYQDGNILINNIQSYQIIGGQKTNETQ